MTTVFDAGGEGSAKACWALMRRARADRFESANSAAIPSPFQGLVFPRPKKPDRYWSAPREAKRPAISVVEIGYVRRSELTRDGDLGLLRAGEAHDSEAPVPRRRGAFDPGYSTLAAVT